jgi:hypothetical protein
MELEIVGISKNIFDRSSTRCGHEPSAFEQPVSQDRVSEIRFRLIETREGVALCHRTAPQPFDLRKNEPHPVALLAAEPQLGQDLVKNLTLRIDKPLQIVAMAGVHAGLASEPCFATAARRLRA